jgi:DNA-binding Lrp family transcriptional regulator
MTYFQIDVMINLKLSFDFLGKNLEISGNILKKRAELLEEEQVFKYYTNPVYSAFGFGLVAFKAEIPKHNRNYFIERLAQFEEMYELIFSLEEKCAIMVLLPFSYPEGVNITTIEEFRKKIHNKIKEIELKEYYIIESATAEPRIDLKQMESKLLRLLRQDSRKDLIALSEQLELSKKTLSRYLTKFQQQNLIRYTIGLQPNKIKNFIIHLLLITFEDEKDLNKKIAIILDKIKDYLSYYPLVYPAGIGLFVFSETLHHMEELMSDLYLMTIVKEIEVFFPSSIIRFEGWKDMVMPLKE